MFAFGYFVKFPKLIFLLLGTVFIWDPSNDYFFAGYMFQDSGWHLEAFPTCLKFRDIIIAALKNGNAFQRFVVTNLDPIR